MDLPQPGEQSPRAHHVKHCSQDFAPIVQDPIEIPFPPPQPGHPFPYIIE